MSTSDAKSAIFLTDTPNEIKNKINKIILNYIATNSFCAWLYRDD